MVGRYAKDALNGGTYDCVASSMSMKNSLLMKLNDGHCNAEFEIPVGDNGVKLNAREAFLREAVPFRLYVSMLF